MRTLVWDIETGNFKADVGRMLCAVAQDAITKEVFVFRRDDPRYRARGCKPTSDAKLVKCFRDFLAEYDIWVTYNGKMFDVPFLNTRLLRFGHEPLPDAMHADIYYQVRAPKLKLCSARLENAMRFFKTEARKIPLDPGVWMEAIEGDSEAMDSVVEHCIEDVRGTTEVFEKVKSRIRGLHR